MKNISSIGALAMSALLVFSSCGKDEDPTVPTLTIADSYVSSNWENNTSNVSAIRTQFNSLVTYMKTGQDGSTKLDGTQLNMLLNQNNLLADFSGDFKTDIQGIYFPSLVKNSGQAFHPDSAATAVLGGAFEGRLLSERAYEILQAVDKGLYGAGYLNQIITLGKGTLDQAKLDQMLAFYGAHPSFPNTPTAANAAYPDVLVANYAARRDKNDGQGLYSQIKRNFLTLQATLLVEGDWTNERKTAQVELQQNIEKALAATTINYMKAAVKKLSATSLTDADKAGALHDLGEAYGFILGFNYINSADRMIQSTDLDYVLGKMGKNGTDIHQYSFVNDPVNSLPNLEEAWKRLATVYGFTTQEMADFEYNWVSTQSR
ncbi:MAG: DUF4856 domain-containing protein [Bacteroidetes bacterium]|nr:MAG: DUF4856 domain-containing protein [Bacteroidota bacterium]